MAKPGEEMPPHPKFMCIGAQKSGTRWLYDQAQSHPLVWMPPIKEIRFFTDFVEQLKARAEEKLDRLMRRGDADERDLEFLRRTMRLSDEGKGRNFDEYIAMFEPAGECVTGDITPGYHRLDEEMVAELARRLPSCRFLFLLRDPIERLWSQVTMLVRGGKELPSALTNKVMFEGVVRRPLCVSPSFQSVPIRRWYDIVGGERFRVFVMDELRADPVAYRRAIFAHIGLNADDCSIDADHNRKTTEWKARLPDEFRGFLSDYFADEYDQLKQLVDNSKVQAWPLRHKPSAQSAGTSAADANA